MSKIYQALSALCFAVAILGVMPLSANAAAPADCENKGDCEKVDGVCKQGNCPAICDCNINGLGNCICKQ
jgi:hypothetical protein